MSSINELQFTQSGTFPLEVIWQDSDGAVITNIDSAQMQLKTNKTDAYGGIVLDAAAGKLTITITDEQTAALPAGVCYYDLIIEQDDDSKHVLLAGTVTVEQGVTTWQS
jgi:hypothetical protein